MHLNVLLFYYYYYYFSFFIFFFFGACSHSLLYLPGPRSNKIHSEVSETYAEVFLGSVSMSLPVLLLSHHLSASAMFQVWGKQTNKQIPNTNALSSAGLGPDLTEEPHTDALAAALLISGGFVQIC